MTVEELHKLENKFVILTIRVPGGEREWRGYLRDCDSGGIFSLSTDEDTPDNDPRNAIGDVSDIITARVVTKEEARW